MENQQTQKIKRAIGKTYIPLLRGPVWFGLINKAGAFADLERDAAESSGAAAGAARLRQHMQW